MDISKIDVKQFIKENDIKFIRLAFCDVFGRLKNISVMAEQFERAYTQGISFDASAALGFLYEDEADLYLFPDLSTMSLLPWRPQQGRVVRFYCNIVKKDGTPFTDGRQLLKKAVQKAESMGFDIKVGVNCEFYLFENDENGNPTQKTLDKAGYLDVAPLDKGENVRREICLIMEQMGIMPLSSNHEQGPGQNEIKYQQSDPLTCADNLITLKSVISTTAERNGLHASFAPKPLKDFSGNGLQISLSLFKDKENLVEGENNLENSQAANFVAGILDKCSEITLFLNPDKDSYKRFGSYKAPKYISWSTKNLSQLLRVIIHGNDSAIELRSPDSMCNPYIAFALIIHAGLYGIENNLKLPKSTDVNLLINKSGADGLKPLPENISSAADETSKSEFIKNIIPDNLLQKFISLAGENIETL